LRLRSNLPQSTSDQAGRCVSPVEAVTHRVGPRVRGFDVEAYHPVREIQDMRFGQVPDEKSRLPGNQIDSEDTDSADIVLLRSRHMMERLCYLTAMAVWCLIHHIFSEIEGICCNWRLATARQQYTSLCLYQLENSSIFSSSNKCCFLRLSLWLCIWA
jgi:hypothetical protein